MVDANQLPDDLVRSLYQVPPEGFVAERAKRVKEAKDAGDRDAAAAIGRLRRPPVSAWALARLAAEDASGIEDLLASNRRLRDAMSGSGGGGDAFRRGSDERLRVVTRLTEQAGSILEEAGLAAGRPTLDRIETTLMATATDEAGADLLRRGVLGHDLTSAGFGDVFGLPLGGDQAAAPEAPAGTAGEPARQGRVGTKAPEDDASKRRRERAERELTERQAEVRTADAAATAAERDAQAAEREAEAAAKVAAGRRTLAERRRKEAARARERARAARERLERDGT